MKKTYQDRKAEAREEAKEWQITQATQQMSWGQVAEYSNHFEKLAKRYGLIKEFKENGII